MLQVWVAIWRNTALEQSVESENPESKFSVLIGGIRYISTLQVPTSVSVFKISQYRFGFQYTDRWLKQDVNISVPVMAIDPPRFPLTTNGERSFICAAAA